MFYLGIVYGDGSAPLLSKYNDIDSALKARQALCPKAKNNQRVIQRKRKMCYHSNDRIIIDIIIIFKEGSLT